MKNTKIYSKWMRLGLLCLIMLTANITWSQPITVTLTKTLSKIIPGYPYGPPELCLQKGGKTIVMLNLADNSILAPDQQITFSPKTVRLSLTRIQFGQIWSGEPILTAASLLINIPNPNPHLPSNSVTGRIFSFEVDLTSLAGLDNIPDYARLSIDLPEITQPSSTYPAYSPIFIYVCLKDQCTGEAGDLSCGNPWTMEAMVAQTMNNYAAIVEEPAPGINPDNKYVGISLARKFPEKIHYQADIGISSHNFNQKETLNVAIVDRDYDLVKMEIVPLQLRYKNRDISNFGIGLGTTRVIIHCYAKSVGCYWPTDFC